MTSPDRQAAIGPHWVFGTGPVARDLARMTEPVGFIDDFSRAKKIDGLPVQPLSLVPAGQVVVNCATLRTHIASNRLRTAGMSVLSVFQVLRDEPQLAAHVMPEIVDWREHLNGAEDRYEQVLNSLADEESRDVLRNLLDFWANWDERVLSTFSFAPRSQYVDVVGARAPLRILDIGAFTGDTVDQLLRAYPQCEEVVCVEPDPENFLRLINTWSHDPRVSAVLAVVSGSPGPVPMDLRADSTSRVDRTGVPLTFVGAITLERLITDRSFIKMDIEGGELDALTSGASAIARHRPQLATACYHYPGQLLAVFDFVSEARPDSALYLRHYTQGLDETVLYAF